MSTGANTLTPSSATTAVSLKTALDQAIMALAADSGRLVELRRNPGEEPLRAFLERDPQGRHTPLEQRIRTWTATVRAHLLLADPDQALNWSEQLLQLGWQQGWMRGWRQGCDHGEKHENRDVKKDIVLRLVRSTDHSDSMIAGLCQHPLDDVVELRKIVQAR